MSIGNLRPDIRIKRNPLSTSKAHSTHIMQPRIPFGSFDCGCLLGLDKSHFGYISGRKGSFHSTEFR